MVTAPSVGGRTAPQAFTKSVGRSSRASGRSYARREAGVSRVRDDGSEAKRIRFLYQIRGCDNGGNDNVEPGHPDRCERFACGLRHGARA